MLYPLRAEDRSRIPILEEVASMPTVSSPRSGRVKTDKNNLPRTDGNECLDRYLRDVWRYSVLSRESERPRQAHCRKPYAVAEAAEHLLHIPLLLAWRFRICQGSVRLTSLCRQGAPLLLSSRPRCSVYALCVTRCVKWSRAGPATGSCRRTVAVCHAGVAPGSGLASGVSASGLA